MFIARLLTSLLVLAFASIATAQNPFAPVIEVNEDVITAFELEQRILFQRVVSPANSGRDVAQRELINDRLRAQAVRQAGLELSEQDVRNGMDEFASRVNLTSDELIQAFAQRGIQEETFRDFVRVGIAWRDLIRARFGARVQITQGEIDRALAASGGNSGVRVLLSEIIMPAPPANAAAVLARAETIAAVTTEAQFSSYARRFSATASRGRGGRLPWTPLSKLPAALRPLILGLAPGEVTRPIPIPNAVALFQMRAIEETDAPNPEYSAIEYARYFIPGGRSAAALAEAKRIRANVDVCDDLYGIAKDQPEEILVRDTKTPDEVPQDIAIELAKLDANEVSTALTSADGQSLVFLMLCGRTAAGKEEITRQDVAGQLRSQRLNDLADSYLEQLRADARIRFK